jgi:hypothetical protein
MRMPIQFDITDPNDWECELAAWKGEHENEIYVKYSKQENGSPNGDQNSF